MEIIFVYLLLINALGAVLMIVDKARARKRMRRISEANLIVIALAGGSLGSLIGMYLVRHKTKHLKFTIGLPIILFVQIMLLLVVIIL